MVATLLLKLIEIPLGALGVHVIAALNVSEHVVVRVYSMSVSSVDIDTDCMSVSIDEVKEPEIVHDLAKVKFAITVRFASIVRVKGLSVESVPVHPTKVYPFSGVAVRVIVEPDSNEPPEESTLPPSPDETSRLNTTDGSSTCSSNASLEHVIKTVIEKK